MQSTQTVGQWLETLATSTQSTESDSTKMQNLLHRVGHHNAIVVLGIVYLDGKGTIDAPPIGIHSMAKLLLEAGK